MRSALSIIKGSVTVEVHRTDIEQRTVILEVYGNILILYNKLN